MPTKADKAKSAAQQAKELHDRVLKQVGKLCSKDVQRDLRELNKIIAGGPQARNAASRVKAIELKLAYAAGRPPQAIKHEGNIDGEHTIVIKRDRNEKTKPKRKSGKK